MMQVELHPQVEADVDAALSFTFQEFGASQVAAYESLIVEGLRTIRQHPTIDRLREDLGIGIRVFALPGMGSRLPHGYVYRVRGDRIQVARLVHLARYLPALIPNGF